MSVFSSRSSGYKVGVVLLFVAAILFVVGYASPFWYAGYGYSEGLWMFCDGRKCSTIPPHFNQFDPWFHAVRTLESLCLIGLVTSCVYCVITNCCRSVPTRRTRFLEVVSAISGQMGFIGSMVYVGEMRSARPWPSVGWSVYMSAFGSALCVFAAITILVCNKPLLTPSPVGNDMALTAVSQGQEQGQGQGHVATGSYDNQAPPQTHSAPYRNTHSYGNLRLSAFHHSDRSPRAYESPPFAGNSQPRVPDQSYGNSQWYEGRQSHGYPPLSVPVQFDGNPQSSNSFQTADNPHPSVLLYSDENHQSYVGRQSADNSQPGSSQPGSSQPGNSLPGSSQPGNSVPGNSQPGNSQPGNFLPGHSQPGNSQPGNSQPGNSQPGSSQPGSSQPGSSQPGSSQPGSSQPGSSQPGSSQSSSSQPASSQPGSSQPASSQPGSSQPGSSQPRVSVQSQSHHGPRHSDGNPQFCDASQSVGKPESHDEPQSDGDSQPPFELSQSDHTFLLPP